MALVKPIAQAKSAFDASQEETFYFSSDGGDQVVKNKLVIKKQSTNEIVYQNVVETYRLAQTVPADTLENGTYYSYYFVTYNIDNESSEDSNEIPFYCYTTPTLTFTNIPESNVIRTSTYEFNFIYDQEESELLDFAIVKLYDGANKLLKTSENIYGTDHLETVYSYTFDGFENGYVYKIEVIGETVNGTIFSSVLEEFIIDYSTPTLPTIFEVSNNCKNGYVAIKVNPLLAEGKSPKTPRYIDNTKLDLITSFYEDRYVEWTQGYNISESFIFQLWGSPSMFGEVCRLWGEDRSYYLKIELGRCFPRNDSNVASYFIVTYCSPNEEKIIGYSNLVESLNNTVQYLIWIKYIKENGTFEFVFDTWNKEDTQLSWNDNDNNNVEYNRMNDTIWDYEPHFIPYLNITPTISFVLPSDIFPIQAIKLQNGIYDHLNITYDIDKEMTRDYPTWDDYTAFDCNFNNNIRGDNFDIILSQVDGLRIKRREKGQFEWITIRDYKVEKPEDTYILIEDSFVPTNTEQEYALVIMSNDIEGNYVVQEVEAKFDGVFISTKDDIFKLYNGVVYGEITNVKPVNILQPINSKYPVVIQNSNTEYKNVSVSGTLCGYNFEKTRKVDVDNVVKQTDDLIRVLKNKEAICVKDWLGNIFIGRPSGDDAINYDLSTGQSRVTFSFVEQGKYDNQEDLYENGLI